MVTPEAPCQYSSAEASAWQSGHDAGYAAGQDANCASVAAIRFALAADDGFKFLLHWFQGRFDVCRRNWPEAPEAVYIGADPLYVPAPKLGEIGLPVGVEEAVAKRANHKAPQQPVALSLEDAQRLLAFGKQLLHRRTPHQPWTPTDKGHQFNAHYYYAKPTE